MGYENAYLVQVVLERVSFYALVGFLPAWVLGVCFYYILGEIALLPFNMPFGISIGTLAFTIAMCVFSGVLAVRRVLSADPAEVF
jgi:putative ABC transport system permease protein